MKAEGVEPHLAVIIVGDDPASHVYVNSKVKTCGRLGIRSTHIALPSSTEEATLEHHIRDLNQREDVHGILVQSPLPPHMDEEALTDLIAPHKDVDGFHPQNLGRLVQGRTDGMLPCTPSGVMRMLRWANIDLEGKRRRAWPLQNCWHAGRFAPRSPGRRRHVTVAHSRTQELEAVCKEADVLVAAVGRPDMVKADWVKPGAIVVDVGIVAWTITPVSEVGGWPAMLTRPSQMLQVGSLRYPVASAP